MLAACGTVLALASSGGVSFAAGQIARTASRPGCFGAASRDPRHPCHNRRLAYTVSPSPADARISPNAPCTLMGGTDLMHICAFGAPAATARASIALIGDSHASHWRAGVEVVARAKHWLGLSNTRSGCSYSTSVKDIGEPARSQCIRWTQDVRHWLETHPEVQIVFMAEISGERVIVPRGRDQFAATVAGYVNAWKHLPKSVRHIIVIRDTPKVHGGTLDCVSRAISRHQRAGVVCAVPRAIPPDPAEVAAGQVSSRRVRVVDLNHFICDSRLCYPVVGGALVYKDAHHLTTTFATTLGTYLLRDLNRLMASRDF